MHARTRVWLPTILALFICTFLVAFQPVRRPPKQVTPESAYTFQFDKPLAAAKADFEAKQKEITDALKTEGYGDDKLESVELQSANRIKMKTYAMNQEQASEDEKKLTEILAKKYPGAKLDTSGQQAAGDVEQPIAELGGVLALYKPSPKIKLGLDLQGGLHVVLRCLPYAGMTFATDEAKNQPFYVSAPAPDAKPEPGAPTLTREALETKLKNELFQARLATEADVNNGYVKVNAVAPNRILVETNAPDEKHGNSQRRVIQEALTKLYPGYEIPTPKVDSVPVGPDTAEKVLSIIDRRLMSLSDIREPVIQKQGKDQIIVEIPGVKDPDRVTQILKSTAMLEFRLIPQQYENASAEDTYDEWKDKRTGQTVTWDRVLAESEVHARGSDLIPNSRVEPSSSGPGTWNVTFELKADKKREFHDFTRRNVNRYMAIVLDGKCQMAPVIKSPIPGDGIIEGNFGTEEAGDLRLLLNAGALPVPLEIAENRTVSATLGQDTIVKAMRAALTGVALVMIFMVFYYRVPGLVACVSLVLYILIVLAVAALSQVIRGVGGITLTLPGIAGVILSIGMAVDANVLIFERLKEELRAGKSMRAAIVAGFDRAWTAILDSNLTTLITAAVLYFLGTSTIKSFATMLFIGVVCSMFTAITISRWLVTMVGETKLGRRLALFGVPEMEKR